MSNRLDALQTTAQSERLFAQSCAVIPGGVNSCLRRSFPQLVFSRADGAMITDVDGNDYLDYHAAFGPILLGHNFEAVNRRVAESMQTIDLVGTGVSELEIELASKICLHVPSAERVAFFNSGSEATYEAIRLARAATGRKKIIKFQGCYHGWHDAVAMNVISPRERIGGRDPLSAGSLPEVVGNTVVCRFNDLDGIEEAFRDSRDRIAAVILEPIPHNVGCILPKPGFLKGLREITQASGTVLIFDEVVTGFRHNLGGYQRICGVTPDLTTLGKAMANGYPIAAVCGKRELMERLNTYPGGDVFFAGTYNGHPIGCAAALATIETLETQAVHEQLFCLGDKMRSGLDDIVRRLGLRATVAGFGSIFLIYFADLPIESYDDLLRNDEALFVSYRRQMLEHGIFELPLNLKRNHISFSHTEQHVEMTLQAAEDILQELTP